MNGINNIQAEGQIYDILAPEVVNEYVEKLGKPCVNPNGYTKGSLILATDGSNVQRLYKVTQNISSNQNIVEGGNVELKKLEDLFDDLEDALNSEIDDIDTELGNVKNALSNEVSVRSMLGAHNIAVGTFSAGGAYGITFTPLADGTVNAYSASAITTSSLYAESTSFKLKAGSYVLGKNPEADANIFLVKASDSSTIKAANAQVDVPFTLDSDTEVKIRLYVYSAHGAYNNVVYKPFIRLASDADTAWSSPVPTNAQLLSYKDNGVLGAKNFLENTATTELVNGITYTVNSDGTISASGTATADSYKRVGYNILLKAGTYILSGCPSNGGSSLYRLYATGSGGTIANDYGDGAQFTLAADGYVSVFILIMNGKTANYTFKPMIRLASDTDTTYQPYAMSNFNITNIINMLFGSNTSKFQFAYLDSSKTTSADKCLEDLVSSLGTLSENTVFVGLHERSGVRGFIAYLYSNKLYGACISFGFVETDIAFTCLNNGTYTRKLIQLVTT